MIREEKFVIFLKIQASFSLALFCMSNSKFYEKNLFKNVQTSSSSPSILFIASNLFWLHESVKF